MDVLDTSRIAGCGSGSLAFVLAVAFTLCLSGEAAEIDFDETSPVISGLEHVHDGDGTDGEGDLVECGPFTDRRGGMRPRGELDDDLADAYVYLDISCCSSQAEIDLKGAAEVTVTAVVYDAPELGGAVVGLEYSNRFAVQDSDLENVFFRHPFLHELEGIDAWVSLSWSIRDASFSSRQHGVADVRLLGTLPDGNIAGICVDRVEITTGTSSPVCPSNLTISVDDPTGEVSLDWVNNDSYRRIRVLRNGRPAAVLPGTRESYREEPGPGRFCYEVLALPAGDTCAASRLRGEVIVFPSVGSCGCPDPDANGDGTIDFADLALVSSNVGLGDGDAGYTPSADVDRNRVVDMNDVQLVLDHLGDLPPPPTAERDLYLTDTLGSVESPGPLVFITSPHAKGSGEPQEDAQSLLRHGRLLAVSDQGPSGKLFEIDPATGGATEFPAASKSDLQGEPALARPTGVDFSGEHVWVANRGSTVSGTDVGTVAVLDRRTAAPIDGPLATGVFAGNEDAIDAGAATGFLESTAGLAPGGSGPDGSPGGQNTLYFQGNSRGGLGDRTDRSASVTAVDLDSGVHRVAGLEPGDGLPGALAFRARGGLLPQLVPPVTVRVEAEDGLARGAGMTRSADGSRLVTEKAGAEDRVLFTVTGLPVSGEYVVRVKGLLPWGVHFSRLRLEALEMQTALDRRLRSGALPGKLGQDLRTVALGRLSLRGGLAGDNLILRIPEPGLEIDALEFEGPVVGRLHVATRDPGTIRVYGLGVTGDVAHSGTLYRGVLEKVIGICPIEAGPGGNFLIDPVALEIRDIGGSEALWVLDAARSILGTISLDDDALEPAVPECYRLPLADQVPSGLALGPVGEEGISAVYIASRSRSPGGAGGQAPAAGGSPPGQGGQAQSAGVQVFSGMHGLFIDRQASNIIEPLGILDRRTLVVRGEFLDGTTRDVTSSATIASLDTDVAIMDGQATIKARTDSGLARIRAELDGLVAEATVCVSPAGFPWRAHVPPLHRVRPLPAPESTLRILPDRESYADVFGVEVNALPLPVGLRQPFTAALVDPQGRLSGLDVEWSLESEEGNSIDADGVFTASSAELAAVAGFDERSPGLELTAEIAGISSSEPLSVHGASASAGAAPDVLRILPRDARLTPGSRLRLVAMLLDASGFPRSFQPEWACDGLPIDEDTGWLTAEYRGETVDETFTVLCRDPASGLCDSTSVTVLYSETTGIATLADAQSVFLGQSLFDGALLDALETARGEASLDEIEVTRANAGSAILSEEVADIYVILGTISSTLKLDYRAEMLFASKEILGLELAPGSSGAMVTVSLSPTEIRSAVFKNLRVGARTSVTQFILALIGLDDPEIQDMRPRPIEVDWREFPLIENSTVVVTARMDLTTGEFSLVEGTWTAANDDPMNRYLAHRIARKIDVEEDLLRAFEQALSDTLNAVLLGEGGVFNVGIKAFCAMIGNAVSSVFGPAVGNFVEWVCGRTLKFVVQWAIGRIVHLIFDLIADASNLERVLRGPMEESVVRPTTEFLFSRMSSVGILSKLREGYSAISRVDDIGRLAELEFADQPPTGAVMALEKSMLPGELLDLVRVQSDEGTTFAEFRHRGVLSYNEENGILLEGLGIDGAPSGIPFGAASGLATGEADLGVTANASDALSSLFRLGGSSAYRRDGLSRGSVPLDVLESRTTASDGSGNDVTLAASCVSAPLFEFRQGENPGDLAGQAHLLLRVPVTGDLDFTVFADAVAPLTFQRAGNRITVDVASEAASILSPADGDLPFADEIRALLETSPDLADLREFIRDSLDGQLPIAVEYPLDVAVPGLGALSLEMAGNDTDPGFEDDFLSVAFGENQQAIRAMAALFRRGDCDGSGRVDLSDFRRICDALFGAGDPPGCLSACDVNGSGDLNVTDAIYLVNWLLDGLDPPPAPFPRCGWRRDAVGCSGGHHGCP